MKKFLYYSIIATMLTIGCSKDSGPTYCWWCIDNLGNDVTIVKDKTEEWAKKNSGKYRATYNYVGIEVNTICNSFDKTNCQ